MKTIPCKTILQKNKSTWWFGNDYNMNLYRGCSHGCIYCDSRSECYQIDNFSSVRVKENCLEILRDELKRKIRSGVIGTGSMSDPYNPFEKDVEYSRHAFELIDAYEFGATVITKSDLITRDIDIFKSIKEHSPVLCKMTITTSDDKLCKLIEPNVCVSSNRFEALAKMSDNGIFTGITLMPVLPFIEDNKENIISIVKKAHESGVRCIYPDFGVTLRDRQRDYFYKRIDEIFPDKNLSKKYRYTYGNNYNCSSRNAKELYYTFVKECEKYKIIYNMNEITNAYKMGYGDMQLSFFD